MIIGTAGHIDHGKTTLVRTLTGVDTDRLKEEKARGISIELGYAYQAMDEGEILGFVDVPGHEKFVHTMLAGATGIDFALLVVAADDGVMPQTREHLAILDLLGVDRGAVAITKADRVEPQRLAEVEAEVAALLAPTALAGAPGFAVAAPRGDGIGELRAYLHAAALRHGCRHRGSRFRLAVDRCFTLSGIGTVVTGTVFSGAVKVGDTLCVSPGGLTVRVRSLHAQNQPAQSGRVGQRCALNLAGAGKEDIARGDWVLDSSLHAPTSRIDVRLRLLRDAPRPLKHWSSLQVHLGAAHATGCVALLDAEQLQPGATALAQLVLDKPIGALHGDRFIVRDPSAATTLGGGMVLDPLAPARHRRTPQRLALLAALVHGEPQPALHGMLHQAPLGVDLPAFARNFNLGADELAPLLTGVRRVSEIGCDIGFAAPHWQALRQRALSGLVEFHARFADELGPDAARLRRMQAPQLAPEAWAALLAELLDEARIVRSGPWLHLPEHSVRLSPADEQLARRLLPALQAQPFEPPWVRDLAHGAGEDEGRVRQLLLRLTRRGDVFQVVRDLFFDRAAVSRLAAIAAGLAREEGGVCAARFRDATGLGRKRAIQILEFFDRVGYTRRVRDEHRIRGNSLLKLEDAEV